MSVFDPVFTKAESTRRWLGMDEGRAFYDTLREWLKQADNVKQTGRETVDIARAQGKAEIISRILNLREELGDYAMGKEGRGATSAVTGQDSRTNRTSIS